jgi:voltage-gated potassium channel Kch
MTAQRRGWAARVDAATPPHRDRTVDALRAVAIVGVVLGHWLVSAVVSDPYQPAALHGASPLTHAPALAPATWFLETLGPFFCAAGYAAARGSRPLPWSAWLAGRFTRLVRPVLVLAAVWLPAFALLWLTGAPASTRHLVLSLVSHPLWFLLVYTVLTALTPLLRAALARYGLWSTVPLIALVALADASRSGPADLLGGSAGWLAVVAVPAGWAVPYLLGMALATGRLPRRAGAALLVSGVVGGAVLVLVAGYPASAVGVPGERWSNLDPPSLFALALSAAQLGAFLLVRPWLAGLLRRPAAWAPVVALNLVAMTVFCWHQTALLLVTFAGLLTGRPPGLLDAPTGGWPWHRCAWLPAFALALTALVLLFHRAERHRPAATAGRRPAGPDAVRPRSARRSA